MAITKTPRLDQTRWSSGQDPVKREDFDSDAAEVEANAVVFKEGPITARPAAGVTGRFYTVKDDPTAANNGRQFYDNGVEWKAPSYTNNQLAESINPGDTALTVRGQASPTVNLFNVQNSASQNHLAVTKEGYTTNQLTLGTSGGAQLGYDPSHAQTGLFVAVDPTKPVVVVRGVAGQSGNLLEFRDSTNTVLAQVNAGGGATFTGPITTTGLTVTGTVTAPNIVSTGPTSLVDATVVSGAASHTALTIEAVTSQSTNLMEFYSATGTRSARFVHDGTFATSGRLFIGGNAGNSGTQTYSNATAIATFKNTIDATTPILNLYANPSGQTARMIQGFDSNNVMQFSFDTAGNMSMANNIDTNTLSVGKGMNNSPTPYFNSNVPKFEVVTGTATGAYDESITVRHSAHNSSAVSRSVGIKLKLSDESNQVESNKFAGIAAFSTGANGSGVGLQTYFNGQPGTYWDSTGDMYHQHDIFMRGAPDSQLWFGDNKGNKIFLGNDINRAGSIGTQSANTLYMRADQMALYSGGSWASDAFNTGSANGVLMAAFTKDRTTLQKLTLTTPTAYDSTVPTLQIGTTAHMQFSAFSINGYNDAANTQPGEINLANNGGNLRLGSGGSNVSIPSRRLYMGHVDDTGNNLILFNGSANGSFATLGGRQPANNDWWFDSTNNRIGCYDGSNWHWVNLS